MKNMAVRRRRRSRSLAAQAFELGMAAPVVIAHRLARMASAGATPSASDHEEFRLMGSEKIAAASEAWMAMASQTLVENQKLALGFVQSFWLPGRRAGPKAIQRHMNQAALRILGKGMTPVHRRAVANARRLGGNPGK
jgi:hypothetical protein